MSNKKYTISYRIQKGCRDAMADNILQSGYGQRGKSRWVTEALTSFLSRDDYISYIEENSFQSVGSVKNVYVYPDHFSASADIKDLLEEKTLEVRRRLPHIKGTQSEIIRAAIMQRLIRKDLGNKSDSE